MVPNLFGTRYRFHRRHQFSSDSSTLHLSCTALLLLLHQLHLRSSGIRSWRLGTLAVELASSHLFFPWSETKSFHGFWAEIGMLHWLKRHWARKTLVGTWQEQVGNSFSKTRCIWNMKPYQLTFYTSLCYNPLIYLVLCLHPYPFVMSHYGH